MFNKRNQGCISAIDLIPIPAMNSLLVIKIVLFIAPGLFKHLFPLCLPVELHGQIHFQRFCLISTGTTGSPHFPLPHRICNKFLTIGRYRQTTGTREKLFSLFRFKGIFMHYTRFIWNAFTDKNRPFRTCHHGRIIPFWHTQWNRSTINIFKIDQYLYLFLFRFFRLRRFSWRLRIGFCFRFCFRLFIGRFLFHLFLIAFRFEGRLIRFSQINHISLIFRIRHLGTRICPTAT